MCGIAGIISLSERKSLSNTVNKQQIHGMLSRINKRGPDESGIVLCEDYTIGNVRLKIVGGDQGKQPMGNDDHCLVFNGEIYNYKSLLKQIDETEIVSDTATLFLYLTKFSMDSLPLLNGIFAFCYVTSDEIYLVRDRFGEKPLFYTIHDNKLYFSSEMKSFLNIIDFNLDVSETYMSLETEIADKTIFKNIFQVKAGNYIKINRKTKSMITVKYYNPEPKQQINKTEKNLLEELRYLVEDAIILRKDPNMTLATYCSGGIDSSIIAKVLKPDYIFSYIPNSKLVIDEQSYVDILGASIKNSKLIKVRSNNDNFLKEFIDMIYVNDGPTTTFGAYAQYVTAKEANKYAIRIAYTGMGADEFFNGYVRHAIATVPSDYFKQPLFASYSPLIKRSGLLQSDQSPAIAYSNMIYRNNQISFDAKNLLSNYFLKYSTSLSAISMTDSSFILPPLLHIDDHINMSFSIESRGPYMDYRVIEFALGIPDDLKININKKTNQVFTKYLLRKAFKDMLPNEIYSRKDKMGLISNVPDLLRGEMNYIFSVSYNILKSAFPYHPYLTTFNDLSGQFSRWEYQICQLAITYLLFTKMYTKEEVTAYYRKHSSS